MADIIDGVSHTFNEFLLIPRLTTKDCTHENISLTTYLTKVSDKCDLDAMRLNIPMVSAAMQSVSDTKMAIALAQEGGLSFIYCSQSIEEQCKMVRSVKLYKAGFVASDTTLSPKDTVATAMRLRAKTGHSTIAITENGCNNDILVGLVTSKDLRLSRIDPNDSLDKYMTPIDKLVVAYEGISLHEANDIIWRHKLNCLPIIDRNKRLKYLTFRKDYDASKKYTSQLVDAQKRLMVGAAINTWDYMDRVPALIDAGADILCVDSSDGYSEYQFDAIKMIKNKYGDKIKIGGGNIVYPDAFNYLVEAGADFVKVGIGGGSICITREQKGIGRGQASAIIDIARERDALYQKTGVYIPICADGGIVHDYHITLAIAMGADFVMLGRYFARFDESPGKKTHIGNQVVKEHWGEGTKRSANWSRYLDTGRPDIIFEEGVDSFVPYVGGLDENLQITLAKLKSAMISCGAKTINDFQKNALLTIVSPSSIVEGGAHDLVSRPMME